MTSLPLSSRPSAARKVSAELQRRARWARDAYALDQEFGPVPDPVPMLDGESVSDWRARNREAMRLARMGGPRPCGWCGAQPGECDCDSYGVPR